MNKRAKKRRIDDGLLNEIVDRIRSISTPRQIILFGSAANEAMTSDSDLDLLVIKDDLKNPREENLQLRKVLSGIGLPVDIFAMTVERFSETKDVIGGLAYPANKYGKVIYEEP